MAQHPRLDPTVLQEVHQNQPDRVAVGELKAERDSWRGKRWEMRLGNGWQ